MEKRWVPLENQFHPLKHQRQKLWIPLVLVRCFKAALVFSCRWRKGTGRRGRAALWTVAPASGGSPSACCCLCSTRWTWWTWRRSSWTKPSRTWRRTAREWGTTSAAACRTSCPRADATMSSGSSGSSVSPPPRAPGGPRSARRSNRSVAVYARCPNFSRVLELRGWSHGQTSRYLVLWSKT